MTQLPKVLSDAKLTLVHRSGIWLFVNAVYDGQMQGLCGDYDGDATNDYTLRNGARTLVIQEFGNSWKLIASCPDVTKEMSEGYEPCEINPIRSPWAHQECKIIKDSAEFAECRQKVNNYMTFYEECTQDACA